jgi:membrane-bound metal-dependent hydrolase YbcI (DUF457 family)
MPSPVAHSLVGLGAVLLTTPKDTSFKHLINKHYKKLFLFIFLANLPDIDMVAGLFFMNGNVHVFHGQLSHSFLAAFLMAAGIAFIWPLDSFKRTFLMAFILITLHDLMDFCASSDLSHPGAGVQLFYPWKERIASPVPIFYGFRHQTLNQLVSFHNLKVVALEIVLWGGINGIIFYQKFVRKG